MTINVKGAIQMFYLLLLLLFIRSATPEAQEVNDGSDDEPEASQETEPQTGNGRRSATPEAPRTKADTDSSESDRQSFLEVSAGEVQQCVDGRRTSCAIHRRLHRKHGKQSCAVALFLNDEKKECVIRRTGRLGTKMVYLDGADGQFLQIQRNRWW